MFKIFANIFLQICLLLEKGVAFHLKNSPKVGFC